MPHILRPEKGKKDGVSARTIYWNPIKPGLSNDGNAFSVIEW